ncbi:MAG TPA: hypothetical protein VGR50_01165 [Terriglobales bacterium]|nr:hypothetical protein [Terriglobales bacterium]
MNKLQRTALLFALGAMVLALAGCPQQTTVAQINGDPGAYFNKEVALVGTVSNSYGLLGNGVYQINDGTGSIWVLAEGYGVPGDGERVGVTGTVIPTLTFGGKSYATGIRETRRRTHP